MVTTFEFWQALANYIKMNTVNYFKMFPIDHLYKSCIDVNLTHFLQKVEDGVYDSLEAICLFELLNDLSSQNINEISFVLSHHIVSIPELVQVEKFIYLYRYSEQENLFVSEVVECCEPDCLSSFAEFNVQGVKVRTNISFQAYSFYTFAYINQSYESMKLNLSGDVELNPGPTSYSKENEQAKMIHKLERQVKQLRKLNEKRDNFFQRSLELEKRNRQRQRKDYSQAKRHAQGLISTFQNIGICAEDLASNIKPTMQALQDVLNEAKATLGDLRKVFNIPEKYDVISIIVSALTIGASIMDGNKKLVAMHVLNLSRLLHIGMDQIVALLPDPKNQQIVPTAQSDGGFIDSLVNSVYTPIASILSFVIGLFTCMFGGKAPSAVTVMSNFALAGRAAQGFKNIREMVYWLVDKCSEIYHQHVYGLSVEEYKFTKLYPEMSKIYAAVKLIIDIKEDVINESKEVAQQILSVNKTLNNYLSTAHMIGSRGNIELLKGLLQTINAQINCARKSPALKNSLRKEPMCMYFYGRPGVGKSTLTSVLRSRIYKQYIQEEGTQYEDCYYSRKSVNEFWDGYNHQKIVEYDDFANMKDSVAKPNLEFGEIIGAVNISPYPLHMAELSAKANTYFDSDWILVSSNAQIPDIVSMTDKGAVFRRFHICVEVTIDPKYGVESGGYYRYDAKKAANVGGSNLLSTNHYILNLYKMHIDVNTGAISAKPIQDGMNLSFEQFWEYVKNFRTHQMSHNIALDEAIRAEAGIEKAKDSVIAKEILDKFIKIFDPEEFVQVMSDTVETGQFESAQQEPNIFSGFMPTQVATSIVDKFNTHAQSFKDLIVKNFKIVAERIGKIGNELVSVGTALLSFLGNAVSTSFSYIASTPTLPLFAVGGIALLSVVGGWCAGLFQFNSNSQQYCNFSVNPSTKITPCLSCKICRYMRYPDSGDMYEHYISKLSEENTLLFLAKEGFDKNKMYSFVIETMREKIQEYALAQKVYDHMPVVPRTKQFAQKVYDHNVGKPQPKGYAQRVYDNNVGRPQVRSFAQNETYLKTDLYKGCVRFAERDIVQIEQTTQVLLQNAVWIQAVDKEGLANRSNGVFLVGRTMITTAHTVLNTGDRVIDRIVITNPYASHASISIPFKDCKLTQLKQLDGTLMDLVLIHFPSVVPNRRNIISKFISSNDIDYINEGELTFSAFTMAGNKTIVQEKYANHFKVNTKATEYYLHTPGNCPKSVNECICPIEISNYIDYDLQTMSGMCGALLSVNNKLIHSKLIGFHVAGGTGVMALGAIATRELINENLKRHVKEHNINAIHLIDGKIPYSQTYVDSSKQCDLITKGDCINVGVAPSPSAPATTQLAPSLIFDKVQEHQTIPAFLSPVKINGEVVDPMMKGITKIMSPQVYIDAEILEIAANDVFNQVGLPAEKGKILSYEQAILGVDGDMYMRSVNRMTSPGYPYNLKNTSKGKTQWLGCEDVFDCTNEELRSDVEKLIDDAKRGIRGDAISIATLKDEKRPIAKVMAGKTRVFEACPQHLVLAIRQYYLDFAAHIMRNRIDNGIAVGINPYSLEWSRVARRLQSKGDFLVAGDFSNFDGSLSMQVLNKILEKINMWYDGSEEDNLVRACLWEHICNADVIVRGQVIRQTHSQPSGNPLTVIINSLFNCIIMRVAYLMLKKERGMSPRCDYTEKVADIVYGDDDIKSIHCSIIDWFNQETITEVLARIGLTYTDETKTGNIVKHKSLKEVNFLKRSFVLLDDGTYVAPMSLDNILEISNWVRGKALKTATVENCEMVLKELALHPRNVYEDYGNRLRLACRDSGLQLYVPSYYEMWDEYIFERNRYEQMEYEPLY